MLFIFKQLLQFIFPLSEDEQMVQNASTKDVRTRYRPQKLESVTVLSSFRDPLIRSLIHTNKFHGNKKSAELLSSLLETYVKQLPKEEYVLMPIPLSKNSLRRRGFNQVTQVAKILRQNGRSFEIREDILYKKRETKPQTSFKREERIKNLSDVFGVRETKVQHLIGKHIILFDDVTTTGTTLREAKAALSPHSPASIICIAIAH